MLSINDETRHFITESLKGDPALMSLAIAGGTTDILAADIAPGTPPSKIGGCEFTPAPPFRREIVVELIVRMQRLRWRRYDDFVLGLSPPNETDWQMIRAVIGVSPEHGPGWYDLILAAAAWIIELGGDPATSQLKEKFGTLRWYGGGTMDALSYEITEAAEHISRCLCEVCGSPGKRRNPRGWVRTVCDEHNHD